MLDQRSLVAIAGPQSQPPDPSCPRLALLNSDDHFVHLGAASLERPRPVLFVLKNNQPVDLAMSFSLAASTEEFCVCHSTVDNDNIADDFQYYLQMVVSYSEATRHPSCQCGQGSVNCNIESKSSQVFALVLRSLSVDRSVSGSGDRRRRRMGEAAARLLSFNVETLYQKLRFYVGYQPTSENLQVFVNSSELGCVLGRLGANAMRVVYTRPRGGNFSQTDFTQGISLADMSALPSVRLGLVRSFIGPAVPAYPSVLRVDWEAGLIPGDECRWGLGGHLEDLSLEDPAVARASDDGSLFSCLRSILRSLLAHSSGSISASPSHRSTHDRELVEMDFRLSRLQRHLKLKKHNSGMSVAWLFPQPFC